MQPIPEEDANRVSMEALQSNMRDVDVARTYVCILGGVMTGILGSTGLHGLISFIVMYVTIGLGVAVKANFDFKQYMNCTLASFLVGDLQKNGLSFILFWTMTYALIYIY